MTDQRRPLGLPNAAAPAAHRPATGDRRPLPPVDRSLFLPPAPEEPATAAPGRRRLAAGGLTFTTPES
ncbi:hypothetical protein GCM10010441_61450 [Kitasatospora paracochleata]|uniref:Uncharacterized protein n=1 Tax=Kitasatospora paracochleata TaxID=58354 RepID=A0ABT1J212_9ACTN|nr:hypothetical protein [Kitasatospora paracochleata]MCP2311173.1 hypothetical protein [Kitasatospora paracochleata]